MQCDDVGGGLVPGHAAARHNCVRQCGRLAAHDVDAMAYPQRLEWVMSDQNDRSIDQQFSGEIL